VIVVASKGTSLIAWFELPSSVVASCIDQRSVSRSEAVFQIEADSGGSRYLTLASEDCVWTVPSP
jgi:hypothetical protein